MPRRARIEATARKAFPEMRYRRCQMRLGPVHSYEVTVELPGYESRRVTVEFWHPFSSTPKVFADGPSGPLASPHRYSERGWRRLCIWYPSDPPERRWVPDDGLLMLFGMAAEHLFKEAWWREHDEWIGDEAPHGDLTGKEEIGERDTA